MSDQVCYSAGPYLRLPLNKRGNGQTDEFHDATVGVCGERRAGYLPNVLVHLTLEEPNVDVSFKLTTDEAMWLANELSKTAELISVAHQGPGDETPRGGLSQ